MEDKKYEELFFTDDFMFCKVMQDESICKRVIKVLLGIEVEKLTYLNRQQDIRPDYSARGVRLDVVAKDTGRIYDIEMQTTLRGDLPKRARYYQALMDIDNLEKRQPYSELPDSFIVFICTQDPFGGSLPRYTVRPTCLEDSAMNEKVDDKTLKVYYNVKEWEKLAESDAEAREFLRFLATQTPQSPLTEEIMEEVMYVRGQEPWRVEFLHLRELREDAQAELKVEIAERDSRIAELEARLAKYEPVNEQLTKPRTEAQAELKAEIAERDSRIAELEAELARYKNSNS